MTNKFFVKNYFNHAVGLRKLYAIVRDSQEIAQNLLDADWTEKRDSDFSVEYLRYENAILVNNEDHFFLENIVKATLEQKKELLLNFSEKFVLVMGNCVDGGTENSNYALEINSDLLELFEVFGIKCSVSIKAAPDISGRTVCSPETIGKVIGEATLEQFDKYYYVPIVVMYNENCEEYYPGLDFLNLRKENGWYKKGEIYVC